MNSSGKLGLSFMLLPLLGFTNMLLAQSDFVWGRQFGSDKEEVAYKTLVDLEGNVYVAGTTTGDLSGSSLGFSDGFLAKFDSAGEPIWTRQFGTKEKDQITWAAIDSKGNIYVTGCTEGMLGDTRFGKEDIIVVKFDPAGVIQWKKQFGTDSTDVAAGISVDRDGNVYVAGATSGSLGRSSLGKADCCVLKLDANGNQLFVRQFGTAEDEQCEGIAVDAAGRISVCGSTWGTLGAKSNGKRDAFVGLLGSDGTAPKFIQFGTEDVEMAHQIIVDGEGNIFVGGSTGGSLATKQQGEGDCFLVRMNNVGERVWERQFGTAHWDGILGIDLSEEHPDELVVSGCQNWPACQSFVRTFKKDGTQLVVSNRVASGKNGGTCGKGVCVDRKGNIYHAGMTGGNLFGSLKGGHDAFVVKLGDDGSNIKP